MKDDSGSYAVFTEQGSSASQFRTQLCLFVNREKGLFLSVYVDDIKLAGKKQNINPMWKVLNKEVDFGEPTSFLDHAYLGCTQRQSEISKDSSMRRTWSSPGEGRTETIRTSEDRQNRGTIPMPTFATRPLTMSCTTPVELPQNYMVGQQRQQISELQFDKFPNPQPFVVWKIRFKNQVTTCSDSPSDAMLWIKEVEIMVDSLDDLKSSRSVCGKIFQSLRCWTRRLPLL